MDLSTYVGKMSSLKDQFSFITLKCTDVKTSQSKTNRVFMILILISLKLDLDPVQKQILTSLKCQPLIGLAQLLRHSSTTTQPLPSETTLDTSMMISQSMVSRPSYRRDCRGRRCKGRGQCPHRTCYNWLASPLIIANSYMVNPHVLLTCPNLLILLNRRLRVRGHLEEPTP